MTLLHGDCLKLMREIPAGSVDMVLCDPPYGTTACKWDSVIPFAPMWVELRRVAKPNAAICLFGSEPFSSALRISGKGLFKYDWIWRKSRPSGHVHAKNKPLKEHEIVSVFSKGNTLHLGQSPLRMNYFPQGLSLLAKPKLQKGGAHSDAVMSRRPSHRDTIQTITNYPRSILPFPSEAGTVHPTQKPVALLEYLIRTYTLPGERVLDFTMGSGSTGVACVNTEREFVGIELDANYFAIAEKRIQEAQAAKAQTLPLEGA